MTPDEMSRDDRQLLVELGHKQAAKAIEAALAAVETYVELLRQAAYKDDGAVHYRAVLAELDDVRVLADRYTHLVDEPAVTP